MTLKNRILTILKLKGLFPLLFSFLVLEASSQEYKFLTLSTPEGLAQPYVYSLVQDHKGNLWIGTADGLSMYNGSVIKTFTVRDSLAGNFISSAIADGEFLWFGHRNGGITFFNGKEFRKIDFKGKELSPVTHFAKNPDGQIWVSTLSDGLFKVAMGEIVFESRIFADIGPVYSFSFITDNELLLGTATGVKNGKTGSDQGGEVIFTLSGIPELKIPAIAKMNDGSGYYVATESEGIFSVKHDGQKLKAGKILTDPAYEFTDVQALCEDARGNIWIGTFRNGLVKLVQGEGKEKKLLFFNKTSGFVSDNIRTLLEDREGNIWSGNYGEGITRITPKLFSMLTFDKELYGNSIFAIFSDSQYLWAGTENGLIKTDRSTGRIVRFYRKGLELPKDTVTAIYKSDGDELWIGTDKKGLLRLNTESGRIVRHTLGRGSLENSVTSITGNGRQVWVGTKKGLFSINTLTSSIIWYSISQGGLPHNSVNNLYIDRKGRIWVSTNSSIIAFIENGKVNKIPLGFGSGILTLGPIAEDERSRIWVGSRGNGVFVIEPDSVLFLTTNQGLLSDYCYSMICDSRQNIWIGSKGGLSRIRTTDFSVKQVHNIDGIPVDCQFLPNAILEDAGHRLFFGSDKGLVRYDAEMELIQSVPPLLSITSVRINDYRTVQPSDKIILSPGKYKIRIEYHGTSLKEPSLVSYQYRLDGYDQWSEITKNTSATYNNLTYGKYTFLLKASSGDGVVTVPPLALDIIIRKPVWRFWWFWVCSVILLVSIVVIYIKWRFNRLVAEKRILEEKVLERTREIQMQKNEIESQRNMIEEKNKNITSSITYAGKIQNAILPPLELLDALLPENFLFHIPRDIVSGDFYWITEKDNKVIFAVADCTGHGVPGAFMSLLGLTLLNEIVNVHGITRSDMIVTTLRERVVQALLQKRKDHKTNDGMDIALCVLDRQLKKLQYTGAMNDLVYIGGGQRIVLKADHMDVSPADITFGKFSMKEVDYKEGDMIYLFSDGYQDQFGGEFDKKFLRPHFYNTLFEMSPLPLREQTEFLEKKLKEWMKGRAQTDDITVLGIRL